jgi:hypothetical protein
MASRSSPSTHSKHTRLTTSSRRSRAELPSNEEQTKEAPAMRGPSEKKHKNMKEVQLTGRQSDQGGKPGRSRKA